MGIGTNQYLEGGWAGLLWWTQAHCWKTTDMILLCLGNMAVSVFLVWIHLHLYLTSFHKVFEMRQMSIAFAKLLLIGTAHTSLDGGEKDVGASWFSVLPP